MKEDNPLNSPVDSFFYPLLLYLSTGFRSNDHLGVDNQARPVGRHPSIYGRYMAQVASAKMRIPVSAN